MARYVYIRINWKQKEAKRIKWKPPSTTPLLDSKDTGEKVCSKNQVETEIHGSIRLYKNQLKAERDWMNQIEATFHDTISGI
jgi:hypothetical protein